MSPMLTEGLIPALLTVWGAYSIALAVPGPNVLAVTGATLLGGPAQGLSTAAGVAAGTLAWCLAGVLGLGEVLERWPALMPALQVAGGLVLAWLGLRMLRPGPAATGGSRAGGLLRGLAAALSNPLNLLIWTSFAGIVLSVGPSRAEIALYVASGTALSFTLHGTLALAVAALPRRPRASADAPARLVCGGAYLFLGGMVVGI